MNKFWKYFLLKLVLFLILISVICSVTNSKAQEAVESAVLQDISWSTKKVDTGVYWKAYRGDDLFNSRQSINLVEIFLDSISTDFKIAFDQDENRKTSQFASQNNALIAVNGSFFSPESGGSVVFLKVDGSVVHEGHTNRNPFNERGAVGWSDEEPIQILKKPENGWNSIHLDNVMSSGPLLIFDSQIQSFNNNPFHQNRHPRTAVAITNDKRLILVTIDGRSFQSYGMTIPELTDFLVSFGVKDALNLDGGGSTTMWIHEMTNTGVVNFPSDNLEFDHEGEREVANALLLLSSES